MRKVRNVPVLENQRAHVLNISGLQVMSRLKVSLGVSVFVIDELNEAASLATEHINSF